jgi:hypothetical protein
VGCESLGDGYEVDRDASCEMLAVCRAGLVACRIPCSSRDVPSGTYLTRTLRRRYSMKPYSGDFSSYWATAARASPAPPVPRVKISRVSLDAYLSRNLGAGRQHQVGRCRENEQRTIRQPRQGLPGRPVLR